MKKIFKILGIVLGILLLAGLSVFLFINSQGIPSYEVIKTEHQVVSTAESIERGKKLTMMLCANCHKDPETGHLTGTQMMDAPPEFGRIFSANITADKEHGIGDWTDGELVVLLRTGLKRNGDYAPPYMAKLPHMADEDIDAIISYLRSGDEMVAADPVPDKPCEPSFLTKFLCTVAFKPLPMPTEKIPMPDTNDRLALGKYLAHNLECFSCHSADFKTNNFQHPELSEGYFGGGNKPLNRAGKVMLTANLTPHKETGIGNWTEDRFLEAVKYGMSEHGPALQYPMIPYVLLSDAEVKAIYHYLMTIPPLNNKVERSI